MTYGHPDIARHLGASGVDRARRLLPPGDADVVIVGGGIVGAASALALADSGLRVVVLERDSVAAGTTGSGEGNILVSDKAPGPELELAVWSNRLWSELAVRARHVGVDIELEDKGGLVVTTGWLSVDALTDFAAGQLSGGVEANVISGSRAREFEPLLSDSVSAGVYYPQDKQVQPAKAATAMMALAQARGASVITGAEVTGFELDGGRIAGVQTSMRGGSHYVTSTRRVVNATGPWAAATAALAGGYVPVEARRGFVLVTMPLAGGTIRHKVYNADYVANVGSNDAGLQASAVVESTPAGTVLIGSTRERVGLDPRLDPNALRALARNAIEVFPALGNVDVIRAYHGFRPYSPDHLPMIGPDATVAGLWHACGHEGAGIGLAPATGRMIADLLTSRGCEVPAARFSPARFAVPAGDGAPLANYIAR